MAVVALDPAILLAGPRAVEASLAEHAGEPLLVRVELDGLDPDDPAPLRRFLRNAPFATLAVGERPPALRDAFDLVTPDPHQGDAWAEGFERSPRAALTATLLVRTAPSGVWPGLVAESTAYSMLQAGPEFRAWRERAAHEPSGPDDDGPRVRRARDGDVTVVSLSRPSRHNALDVAMRDALDAALAEAAVASRGPVVVRGDGPSFCSGGDLGEFGTFPDPVTAHIVRLSRSLAWRFHELERRLIVGLHGACLGAGIELPAFAAHVIAADDAMIGLPELGLGLIPGAGGTVSIPRRGGRLRLLALLLASEPINAHRAREWGLVDEVVPRSRLDDRLRELAARGTG